MSTRVLYLTYDGLTDPLGQSQVLPYLKGLAGKGHRITVISCDKLESRALRADVIAAECQAAGIEWHPLPYRKSPPIISTVADLRAMRRLAFRLHRVEPFDLVHCRSYLTALIGRAMQSQVGARFLFDMRGFWIDERFERGIWNDRSPVYQAIAAWFRRRERDLFDSADAIISLTHAARDELGRRGGSAWVQKTSVIPCCTDLNHFGLCDGEVRETSRRLLGIPPVAPVLLFLGSLGGAYPIEPVLRFFRVWSERREDARLLFVTRHPLSEVLAHREAAAIQDRIIVRPGERHNIPAMIAAADVGVSFILPSFCAIASSPTKVGEMLAMGLPVAANDGVGDMAHIMNDPGAGLLLSSLDPVSVEAAARTMRTFAQNPIAARAVAERWFALDRGVETYDHIYRGLQGAASCDLSMGKKSFPPTDAIVEQKVDRD